MASELRDTFREAQKNVEAMEHNPEQPVQPTQPAQAAQVPATAK